MEKNASYNAIKVTSKWDGWTGAAPFTARYVSTSILKLVLKYIRSLCKEFKIGDKFGV